MKTFIWGLTAVLALLWSGLSWAAAGVVRWTVEALSTGRAAELGQSAVEFKLPEWLTFFLDTTLLEMLQDLTRWVMELAGSGAPLAGALVGWLVPLVWGTWAVGLVVLLAVAGVVHLLVGRLPKIGAPTAA